MSLTNVSTRFMIISDTHNFEFGDAEKVHGDFKLPTPKVDVLLHCGDLTSIGGLPSYKKLLKMLGSIDAELKLVIAGNHDLDLDKQYWDRKHDSDDDEEDLAQHQNAVEIMTGPLAKEAGVTYLVEGLNTFTLKNGAKFTIYTSPYQPEFCDWAFPYERNEDRFNPPEHVAPYVKSIAENIIPDFPGVDIIMTHGPPKDVLDWTQLGNVGCEALLRAVSRARPLLYCFGHIHEAYGCNLVTWKDDKEKIGAGAIESESRQSNGYPETCSWPLKFGKETLMVNAAIMNLRYKPANAPWLVDLDLPRAEFELRVREALRLYGLSVYVQINGEERFEHITRSQERSFVTISWSIQSQEVRPRLSSENYAESFGDNKPHVYLINLYSDDQSVINIIINKKFLDKRRLRTLHAAKVTASVENMSKDFVFVEVAKTGRVTNKKLLHDVRKHIMKDIGRSRRKENKSTQEPQQKPKGRKGRVSRTSYPEALPTQVSDLLMLGDWSLGSGRMDPFACYPIDVNHELLFLIDHVNTWPDIQLRPFKDIWFPISMSDGAFLNEILSHVSLHVYSLRHGLGGVTECPQSIDLHSKAVVSVRKRLDDPVLGISDGIIGTVLAFACFSHRINYWETYDMHMSALHEIVKRRGGVSSLMNNPMLRRLMSGIDLAATCFLEKRYTVFPLPELPEDSDLPTTTLPWPIPPSINREQSIWKHSFLDESPLLPIFHDLTQLILSLKSDALDHRKLGRPPALIKREAIFALANRLDEVSIPIEDITPDNLVQECCRIGGMLLLGGVYDHFPSQGSSLRNYRFMNIASLVRKLHTILVKLKRYKEWVLLKPLLVWSTALGAILSDTPEEANAFLDLILFGGRWLGLHNWMEALMVAGNLLWIGEVFDERYKRLIVNRPWIFDPSVYK